MDTEKELEKEEKGEEGERVAEVVEEKQGEGEEEEGERVAEVVEQRQGEGEEQEEATCSDKELDELLDCEWPCTNYLIPQPGLLCTYESI